MRFLDGREEVIPDLTPLMKPTVFGDIATYTLFAMGGVFCGGEIGLWLGGWRARRGIEDGDPGGRRRIEGAFRRFRADVLRKEAEELERQADGVGGDGGVGGLKGGDGPLWT